MKDSSLIPIGSFVRISLYDRINVFSKLSPNWTKEIYKVKEYDVKRNRYILDGVDGYYPYWKLQVIDKDNLGTYITDRYVVSNAEKDEVKKSRAVKMAEKETKDYLKPGKYYSEKVRRRKKN